MVEELVSLKSICGLWRGTIWMWGLVNVLNLDKLQFMSTKSWIQTRIKRDGSEWQDRVQVIHMQYISSFYGVNFSSYFLVSSWHSGPAQGVPDVSCTMITGDGHQLPPPRKWIDECLLLFSVIFAFSSLVFVRSKLYSLFWSRVFYFPPTH